MKFCKVLFNIPVDFAYTYKIPDNCHCSVGMRVKADLRNKITTGFVIELTANEKETGFKIKELEAVIDTAPVFDEGTLKLAAWVSRMYLCSYGQALSSILPSAKKGRDLPGYEVGDPTVFARSFKLARQQTEAINTILQSEKKLHYCYGVTGSGKTEVFLRTCEDVLEKGKSIIYLVPEISLTHQIVDELRKRFEAYGVGLLHSGLSPGQRFSEWMRIMRGEARFVLGARSAVFAPVKDLGLIIIDEEHENSYKSSRTPRYHARQIAMHRCSGENASLVMGSATPSVEAYHLMNTGTINRINMPLRLSGGAMPEIIKVDMLGVNNPLSDELIHEIHQTKKEGRQTILFLNRRGFLYYFQCRSCGFQLECKHCSVALTYHKKHNHMLCHYCGFKQFPPDVCPSCNSTEVGYGGEGTERIEDIVKTMFPDYTVARLDTDQTKKKNYMTKVLQDFKDKKIDILLGTQMVAKGLNFPGVKLVGIILADVGLSMPDFRACERTFNLIVQVSGRAGRFKADGKVIVQTRKPDNDAIICSSENRIDEFYQKEIETRKALGFPPFSRLFRLVFRGRNSMSVQKEADSFSRLFTDIAGPDTRILGPVECPLGKIARNFRYQLILAADSFKTTHEYLRKALKAYQHDRTVYVEIDIDPVSLL